MLKLVLKEFVVSSGRMELRHRKTSKCY